MSYPDLLITLTGDKKDENNVTIAFTMGNKALDKGHDVAIMLLSDAVKVAEKSYAEKIDIGSPFKPVQDLFPSYLEKGGKLMVCSSCMEHNDVSKSDIVEAGEVISADDVIDNIMNTEKSLQLN